MGRTENDGKRQKERIEKKVGKQYGGNGITSRLEC